jgi:hypothetical protein
VTRRASVLVAAAEPLFCDLLPTLLCAGYTSDIVDSCVECLWNVLESDLDHAAFRLGTPSVLRSCQCFPLFFFVSRFSNPPFRCLVYSALTYLLQQLLSNGYRAKDKALRNEVLVLLLHFSQMADLRPYFARHGLLATLLKFSTWSSTVYLQQLGLSAATSSSDPVPPFTQSKEEEDIEMKKLLWNILTNLAQDPLCLSGISKVITG